MREGGGGGGGGGGVLNWEGLFIRPNSKRLTALSDHKQIFPSATRCLPQKLEFHLPSPEINVMMQNYH